MLTRPLQMSSLVWQMVRVFEEAMDPKDWPFFGSPKTTTAATFAAFVEEVDAAAL